MNEPILGSKPNYPVNNPGKFVSEFHFRSQKRENGGWKISSAYEFGNFGGQKLKSRH